MKNKALKIALGTALFVVAASTFGYGYVTHIHDTPDSHSGGTNAAGCHTNHKTGGYHCH